MRPSPDFNPTENVWLNLKRAVHSQALPDRFAKKNGENCPDVES